MQSQEEPLALVVGDENQSLFICGGVAPSMDGEWRGVSVSLQTLAQYWRAEGYDDVRGRVETAALEYFSDESGPIHLEGDDKLIDAAGNIPLLAQLILVTATVQLLRSNLLSSQCESMRLFEEMGAITLEHLQEEDKDILIKLFSRIQGVAITGSLGVKLSMGGAKIRPLSLAEAAFPGNPKYPAWREWYADLAVSNLVINWIAPLQLPMVPPEMFLIEGTDSRFYFNHSQHERYRRATAMTDTRELVETAKEAAKKNKGGEALDDHLSRALHYIDATVIITDISMLKFVEYAGRPLAVYTQMVADNVFGADSPRNLMFRESAIYDCVVVDWLYALMVLHQRGHILHTDLHANNFTVYHGIERSPKHEYVVPTEEGPAMLRLNSDPRDPRAAGAIIDFSQAVAFDVADLRASLGEEVAAEFMAHQVRVTRRRVDRILEMFADAHLAPVQRFRTALEEMPEALAPDAAQSFFRAVSALDAAMLARACLASVRKCNPSKAFISMMADIETSAVEMFGELLGAEPGAELADHEWPAARLLLKHFRHYATKTAIPREIDDDAMRYTYNAPIDVDVRDPAAYAGLVRDAWKFWGGSDALPAPAPFGSDAEAKKAADTRATGLRKIAAAHRQRKAVDSSGSWVI